MPSPGGGEAWEPLEWTDSLHAELLQQHPQRPDAPPMRRSLPTEPSMRLLMHQRAAPQARELHGPQQQRSRQPSGLHGGADATPRPPWGSRGASVRTSADHASPAPARPPLRSYMDLHGARATAQRATGEGITAAEEEFFRLLHIGESPGKRTLFTGRPSREQLGSRGSSPPRSLSPAARRRSGGGAAGAAAAQQPGAGGGRGVWRPGGSGISTTPAGRSGSPPRAMHLLMAGHQLRDPGGQRGRPASPGSRGACVAERLGASEKTHLGRFDDVAARESRSRRREMDSWCVALMCLCV
jgi:hypothetical protein